MFVTFSHGEVTTGFNWNIKRSTTPKDPIEPWWYKCLCGAIALQGSAENRDGTNVYLRTIALHVCYKPNL